MKTEGQIITVSDWQRRIEKTFQGPNGSCGERTHLLFAAERCHQELAMTELRGIMVLMDAFQDFTIQAVGECPGPILTKAGIKWAMLAATFQRIRSSLNTFYEGYHLDSAATLRSVFESVMYLGAVLNGYVKEEDFIFLGAIQNMSDDEIEKASEQHRRGIDRTVRSHMFGKHSGMTFDDQKAIDGFLKLMHLHVHRSQSNVIRTLLKWKKTYVGPSLLPAFDLRTASVYGTTCVFVAWCFLRVLAGSLKGSHFSEELLTRFAVMDESFEHYVKLANSAYATATKAIIQSKFNFTL